MTEIIKEEGKTIVKTGARIDTLNAAQFEQEIQPALEQGVNLEIDCSELGYMASSGLRILQATMRTVVRSLGGQMKLTHVNDDIFDILKMTGFTRHITVERA
ncbi:MAG: STAS domain-containing protein [Bacteroidales bacterium]|jgi:anti-anti-sigma factor|nr:STAS domain-containing protein [Bacteroidales bacterium]